jgi:hypothetical protein
VRIVALHRGQANGIDLPGPVRHARAAPPPAGGTGGTTGPGSASVIRPSGTRRAPDARPPARPVRSRASGRQTGCRRTGRRRHGCLPDPPRRSRRRSSSKRTAVPCAAAVALCRACTTSSQMVDDLPAPADRRQAAQSSGSPIRHPVRGGRRRAAADVRNDGRPPRAGRGGGRRGGANGAGSRAARADAPPLYRRAASSHRGRLAPAAVPTSSRCRHGSRWRPAPRRSPATLCASGHRSEPSASVPRRPVRS